MKNQALRHVGVLVETDDSWGRNIVEAICQYARDARWTLLICPRDHQGRLRLPKVWNGDGVIASLRNRTLTQHLRNLQKPAVDVSQMIQKEPWFGRVATDDSARAKMAFEHFRTRGFEHFACYAPPIGRYSDERSNYFRHAVEDSGFRCAMYSSKSRDASGWLTNYTKVRQWLTTLPKPLGVFAADPYPARQLAEICAMDSIRIPDDVSILSGDDDELLCNVASPQISSVELASHRIGETAAMMLSRLMKGAKIPKQTTLISPLRIRARHSTDLLAIDDPELALILRYIRDHAQQGIRVTDLLKKFSMSRRSLEMRFQQRVQRSPAEEIRRTKFEQVCRMLLDTNDSISNIARACGFASGANLSQAFQKRFQQTPGEFRQARHFSS